MIRGLKGKRILCLQFPRTGATATSPEGLVQNQPLPEDTRRDTSVSLPTGTPLRPSSEPPGHRCHQARKSNPTVTQNHSDFLNLEMNTNLPSFQKLEPSRRFTPPEGQASQQTKNIQTDSSLKHELPEECQAKPHAPKLPVMVLSL